MPPKGPLHLQKEVLQVEQCTGCGLCAGLCPYFNVVDERVALTSTCGLSEGLCYEVCPRTPTDWELIDRTMFGAPRQDHVLGHWQGLYYARAGEAAPAIEGKQYGGTVTALVAFALTQGLAHGALLTSGLPGDFPVPVLARTMDEVLAAAGSKYSATPTLQALVGAMRDGLGSMVVVGRPCQVLAVRKLQSVKRRTPVTNLTAGARIFLLGLFCFWALSSAFYERFLPSKLNPLEVTRLDLPPSELVVSTPKGELRLPVEELRPFIRPACEVCFDPTAEFADLAVGSTEDDPGWNTLLARSALGSELLKAATAAGWLEVRPYPADRVHLLREAVARKKRRVVTGPAGPPPYLFLHGTYYRGVVAAEEESGCS